MNLRDLILPTGTAANTTHAIMGFTLNPVLSTYSDAMLIISTVGIALLVAMLIFRFDYLKKKDFFVVKYRPIVEGIDRFLFEGRDRRKIATAITFLVLGGFLFASIHGLWASVMPCAYDLRYHAVTASGTGCWPTLYIDSIILSILTMPFIVIGVLLLAFGLDNISFVTLKREIQAHKTQLQ